jgi:quinol monooxygenase YgiN
MRCYPKATDVIVNTTRITVRPENRNELFQTIWPLLEPIRSEKGCVTYRFYIDAADENSSVLIGEWETSEDWHNHLHSRDFAVLLGAITILSSPSSIEFKLLTSFEESEALNRTRLAENRSGNDRLRIGE